MVHRLIKIFWFLSIRGEATIVLQKTKIKVGATLKAGTKILSVTIVIRRGT